MVNKNWLNTFEKNFNGAYKIFKYKKYKNFILTITTNTSLSKKPYYPKLRYFMNDIIFGVVIYSQDQAFEICKKIDGKVSYVFVDSEKKISYKIKNFYSQNKKKLSIYDVDLGNLVSVSSKTLRKSKLIEFKPNDLTVDSAWLLLSNFFKILSGKTIAVIGAGNIGAKISLKLVETGVDVRLNRRSSEFGHKISNAINIIKPNSTVANASYVKDPVKACLFCDAIIGTSNLGNVINLDMVKVMKPNGIVLDIGKGNLQKKAIQFALKNNIQILRLDVNNSIINFINEYLNYSEVSSLIGKCNYSKGINLVSGGYLGEYGDIVVDNYKKPTEVLGIADGKGEFKSKINLQDRKKITLVKKKYNV